LGPTVAAGRGTNVGRGIGLWRGRNGLGKDGLGSDRALIDLWKLDYDGIISGRESRCQYEREKERNSGVTHVRVCSFRTVLRFAAWVALRDNKTRAKPLR